LATRSTDKPASTRPAARAIPRQPILPPPGEPGPALDPRLVAELDGPRWDQSWELTPSIHTAALDPGARQRFWTLGEMVHPFARDAFALSGTPSALDLRCGEGWMAQRLLAWGARHVVAVDGRPERLRRARLLRDHFAIPSAELTLLAEPEWTPPAREDRFDVVLLTGAIDRAGDAETLAAAHAACRSVCAIECRGAETNAVAEAALEAGFSSIDRLRPPLQGAPVYVLEDRDVLIAKVAIGG
jgi:predicted RNA methylase